MPQVGQALHSGLGRLRSSPSLRVLVIGALVLLLQIPIAFIARTVHERQQTQHAAIAEVSQKWGGAQAVVGPFLVVPYLYQLQEFAADGTPRSREARAHATFLPRRLEVAGRLEPEVRERGIFAVPVYRARLQLRGEFDPPSFEAWGIEPSAVLWDQAQLVLEISDARGIDNAVRLRWGDEELDFAPGGGARESTRAAIHAPLGARLGGPQALEFQTDLALRGSLGLRLAPTGQHTAVQLSGSWADPSFQGAWLPSERQVRPEGFEARWEIPYLGRDYPQRWLGGGDPGRIAASEFGLDLVVPVDAYRSTLRSLKYELLFLALTFLTLWLFEVLAGLRVHPIQYGLVGGALCLFYLLELSLAEHVGLGPAYLIAASAVVALLAGYTRVILGGWSRGGVVALTVGLLYAYLYVLLRIEDYALLAGSLGLFAILAAVMYATRNVDWYRLGGAGEGAE
jgi:inner membrane protein